MKYFLTTRRYLMDFVQGREIADFNRCPTIDQISKERRG